jgi:hypothetical protein
MLPPTHVLLALLVVVLVGVSRAGGGHFPLAK